MLQHSHQLYGYHVWANDRLFAHLEQLPKEAFLGEVTSVFPSVAQTFGHMYKFEQLFMHVLAEVPNEDIFPKLSVWEGEARFRLDVPTMNKYLPMYLMTLGTDIRVREPLELKRRVRAMASKLAKHYEENAD